MPFPQEKRFQAASHETYWGLIPIERLNSPRARDYSVAVIQETRAGRYCWGGRGSELTGGFRTLRETKKNCEVCLKLDRVI